MNTQVPYTIRTVYQKSMTSPFSIWRPSKRLPPNSKFGSIREGPVARLPGVEFSVATSTDPRARFHITVPLLASTARQTYLVNRLCLMSHPCMKTTTTRISTEVGRSCRTAAIATADTTHSTISTTTTTALTKWTGNRTNRVVSAEVGLQRELVQLVKRSIWTRFSSGPDGSWMKLVPRRRKPRHPPYRLRHTFFGREGPRVVTCEVRHKPRLSKHTPSLLSAEPTIRIKKGRIRRQV
jgi:hypothetical protein